MTNNNNIFRENTTISKGTRDGGMKTVIKNNNLCFLYFIKTLRLYQNPPFSMQN